MLNFHNVLRNERSLKEVLSVSDYKKTLPIIEYLDDNVVAFPQKAENIIGKSIATTWKDLKLLVDADIVEAEGGTNNLVYRLKKPYRM